MNGIEDQGRVFGVLALSIIAHALVFAGLGYVPHWKQVLRTRALEFEVAKNSSPASEKNTPEAEKPPVKEKPRERQSLIKSKPIETKQAEAEGPAKPVESKPGPQEPIDFPGVTLTAQGGNASWTTVVGTGNAIQGPVIVPHNAAKRGANGTVGNSGSGAEPASTKDFSRPPQPPSNMDALLVKYYPERARSQGIEGQAALRVRIDAEGKVTDMRLIRETYTEFGKACMEHLRNTRWTPALGQSGKPEAFEITYTCRFEISY